MNDYAELIKSLKTCNYPGSVYNCSHGCVMAENGATCGLTPLLRKAADTIEQQQQTIEKLLKTNERLRSQVHSLKSAAAWDEDIRCGKVQGMW